MTKPINQNRIRCVCCGQEATSTHRHDFQQLGVCGNKPPCRNHSFVDGGNDYCRIGGIDMSLVETWNPIEQKWNETTNQLAVDLFRNGKYDFPEYIRKDDFDFMNYQKKRDAAMIALHDALFERWGLKANPVGAPYAENKAETLWYSVCHMPLDNKRDPDLGDVYFNFIHFVGLVKEREVANASAD
jgi:hypothetical protein